MGMSPLGAMCIVLSICILNGEFSGEPRGEEKWRDTVAYRDTPKPGARLSIARGERKRDGERG